MPAPYLFMMHHGRVVVLVELLLYGAALAAAIGLLRRLEWGRRTAIGLLALGIVMLLTDLGLRLSMAVTLGNQIALQHGRTGVPAAMGEGMALGSLVAIAIAAALAGVLLFLRSPRIRAEFVQRAV